MCMKKLSLLTGACILLLTACGPSVDTLVKDTKLRREILKECMDMGEEAENETKCKNAMEAQKLAVKEGFNNLKDQLLLGE